MPRVVVLGLSNTDTAVRMQALPADGETVLVNSFESSPRSHIGGHEAGRARGTATGR